VACRHIRVLLGVYVLGGLRGQQEARVSAHLAGCDRCRAEYEELAEVPAFLDLIRDEDAARAGGQSPDPAIVRAEDGPPDP
jgi:anti-sigma factor RsiW